MGLDAEYDAVPRVVGAPLSSLSVMVALPSTTFMAGLPKFTAAVPLTLPGVVEPEFQVAVAVLFPFAGKDQYVQV
jgi:hypothetical protein